MSNVYQLACNGGSIHLTLEEVKEKYEIKGVNFNARNRSELQGQPKIKGFLGPMYGGRTPEGQTVIRYETQEVYNDYFNN